MTRQNDRNGGTAWQGHQQFDHLPSLIAQSFRVGQEQGRSCSGSLTILDAAFRKSRQFLWQAKYLGGGHWQISGKEAGDVVYDSFSPNKGVNGELTAFVQNRLNDMKEQGSLFKPLPKPTASDESAPPTPPRTAPPPPQPPLPPPEPPAPAPQDGLPASASEVVPTMIIQEVLVSRIRRFEGQPRKYFRKYALRKLGKSMQQDGQRQLAEVRRVYGDPKADFEIITGERRWRAAQIVGMKHLKCIIIPDQQVPDEKKQHRMCFIADFHREGYSKLETALALMREKENGASVEELCEICGRSITWVYQHLALNDLVPELQKLLNPDLPRSERLSFPIACRLARAPKTSQMEVHLKVASVIGARLQLIEVNRLLDGFLPDRPSGRIRGPNDYVRNLGWIAPRAAADAITASGFSDKVFDSLVGNTHPDKVKIMSAQIETAIEKLTLVGQKIKDAQKRVNQK